MNVRITLVSELEIDIGRKLIKEFPGLESNITVMAADQDLVSAYPSGEDLCNVSKTTRAYELCQMGELSEIDQRSVGINLSSVITNALEITTLTHGFPSSSTLLTAYLEANNR